MSTAAASKLELQSRAFATNHLGRRVQVSWSGYGPGVLVGYHCDNKSPGMCLLVRLEAQEAQDHGYVPSLLAAGAVFLVPPAPGDRFVVSTEAALEFLDEAGGAAP